MATPVGRNDPCPCGSGKKYKVCHLGRESELAVTTDPETGAPTVVGAAPHTPTWKLFLAGCVLIAIIGVGLWLADLPRIGGVVSGVAALVLVLWAAFRNPPPRRSQAGSADAINFGK